MLRDSVLALGLRVAGAGLWLLLMIATARLLSLAEFGLVQVVINTVLVLILIVTSGFDMTVLRFGPVYLRDGDRAAFDGLLRQSLLRVAVFGGLLALGMAGLLFAGADTPVTADPEIAALTVLLAVSGAAMTVNRFPLRSAGYLALALLGMSVTRSVFPMLGLAVLLWMGGTATPVVFLALLLASFFLALGIEAWVLFGRVLRGVARAPLDRVRRADHARVALSIWPGEIGNAAILRAAGPIVGLAAGLEEAALFLAAERIAALVQFPVDAVATASAPQISEAAGDRGALQSAAARVARLVLAGGGATAAGLALFSGVVLGLFGPSYTAALGILLILLVAQASWIVAAPAELVLTLGSDQRLRTAIAVVAAAAMIVLVWAGAAAFGAMGAAVAFAAVAWGMNAALLAGARLRAGVWAGLPAILRPDHAVAEAPGDGGSA